jgi:hypothetical protein
MSLFVALLLVQAAPTVEDPRVVVAVDQPAPAEAESLAGAPTRYCREIGSAASRSQAVMICRTRAQWRRIESCNSATRFCPSTKRLASLGAGRETAFPLNENSRIACRYLRVTGSRLSTQKTCLPQREWERMWKDSAQTMRDLQDQSTRIDGPQ